MPDSSHSFCPRPSVPPFFSPFHPNKKRRRLEEEGESPKKTLRRSFVSDGLPSPSLRRRSCSSSSHFYANKQLSRAPAMLQYIAKVERRRRRRSEEEDDDGLLAPPPPPLFQSPRLQSSGVAPPDSLPSLFPFPPPFKLLPLAIAASLPPLAQRGVVSYEPPSSSPPFRRKFSVSSLPTSSFSLAVAPLKAELGGGG